MAETAEAAESRKELRIEGLKCVLDTLESGLAAKFTEEEVASLCNMGYEAVEDFSTAMEDDFKALIRRARLGNLRPYLIGSGERLTVQSERLPYFSSSSYPSSPHCRLLSAMSMYRSQSRSIHESNMYGVILVFGKVIHLDLACKLPKPTCGLA